MSIDLLVMRKKLRKPLGVDDIDFTDDDADLLLNISFWDVLDRFHFREKEATAEFETIVGIRKYDMPKPFEALRKLSIVDPTSSQHTTLKRTTIEDYESTYNREESAQGKPEFYVREDCYARLLPTPDRVYDMVVKYWTTLENLSTTNLETRLPPQWDEIVVFGAIYRGYIDIGDWNRANAAKAHQELLISGRVPTEAKEEIDSHHAGLEVLGRDYR